MKFSIITVAYNSAGTIRRTMRSVLSQTLNDYEYIVVDGLSTDATVDIIKEEEPRFGGRLKWVSERDGGIYDAMNKGAALASGDYLLFLNSDDYYAADMLESVAKGGYADLPDVLYGDVFFVDGKRSYVWDAQLDEIFFQMCMGHVGAAISRNAFSALGGYDDSLRISADWDFFMRAFVSGRTFRKYGGAHSFFCIGGVSSKSEYKAELERLIRKNLTPFINLDYDDLQILFDAKGAYGEDRRSAVFGKMSLGGNGRLGAMLFEANAHFLRRTYGQRISRLENSMSRKISAPIRKILRMIK